MAGDSATGTDPRGEEVGTPLPPLGNGQAGPEERRLGGVFSRAWRGGWGWAGAEAVKGLGLG